MRFLDRRFSGFRLWLFALLVACGAPDPSGEPETSTVVPEDSPWRIEFIQVTEDVHVAYRPEPLRFLVEGNVTIIVNDSDVVVVDGSGAPVAARQVIEHIRSVTPNPVSVVVNTHGHGDHTLGNQEYVATFPGVEIIAHPGTRDYMTDTTGARIGYVRSIAASTAERKRQGFESIAELERDGADSALIANLRLYYEHDIDLRQAAYRELTITPPTLTVSGGLSLHRGGRTIDVLHLGAGDTASDLVVHLPDDGIVVTGDMVVHPIPYGFSRHPLAWATTLERLAELDFHTLIPGHGEVQQGKGYLEQVHELLLDVQEQLTSGLERGLDRDQLQEAVDLDSARDRFAGEDPVLRYYFDLYFQRPHVTRTLDDLMR